jgi:hypothetical protein
MWTVMMRDDASVNLACRHLGSWVSTATNRSQAQLASAAFVQRIPRGLEMFIWPRARRSSLCTGETLLGADMRVRIGAISGIVPLLHAGLSVLPIKNLCLTHCHSRSECSPATGVKGRAGDSSWASGTASSALDVAGC